MAADASSRRHMDVDGDAELLRVASNPASERDLGRRYPESCGTAGRPEPGGLVGGPRMRPSKRRNRMYAAVGVVESNGRPLDRY